MKQELVQATGRACKQTTDSLVRPSSRLKQCQLATKRLSEVVGQKRATRFRREGSLGLDYQIRSIDVRCDKHVAQMIWSKLSQCRLRSSFQLNYNLGSLDLRGTLLESSPDLYIVSLLSDSLKPTSLTAPKTYNAKAIGPTNSYPHQ